MENILKSKQKACHIIGPFKYKIQCKMWSKYLVLWKRNTRTRALHNLSNNLNIANFSGRIPLRLMISRSTLDIPNVLHRIPILIPRESYYYHIVIISKRQTVTLHTCIRIKDCILILCTKDAKCHRDQTNQMYNGSSYIGSCTINLEVECFAGTLWDIQVFKRITAPRYRDSSLLISVEKRVVHSSIISSIKSPVDRTI